MQWSYVSCHWKVMQNLNKNWFAVSKMTRIWWILTRALEMSKICNLMGSSWPKYIMFELKMYRGNYLSWRWRMMQNLKENWLVVWKMTWQIWQIFTRALRSIKVGTMMGSFYPQYKMYELKIYQRIMCHGNEERCKIWRIDLLFQNWHEENDKFWPAEHVKVSKICSLMDSFWPK